MSLSRYSTTALPRFLTDDETSCAVRCGAAIARTAQHTIQTGRIDLRYLNITPPHGLARLRRVHRAEAVPARQLMWEASFGLPKRGWARLSCLSDGGPFIETAADVRALRFRLFHPVVGRFLGNCHVVDVAL